MAKNIFKPDNVEELLRGWLLHAHKGRDRHDQVARRCDRYRMWLGSAASLLSTVVGTSIFASLGNESSNKRIVAIVAFIGILSAILTSLVTFLNLSEQAEKHRSAGVRYKMIVRKLERILSVSTKDLTNTEALTEIETQFDDLEESAPVVPLRIYNRIENEWKKRNKVCSNGS